jgi:hypothetical protein
MNIIKQAWTEMRVQPLIGWVTVAGTALAIFLIMVMVMIEQVQVMPVDPESYRDRYLHAPDMCLTNIEKPDYTASSHMSREAADRLFMNLESAECATKYSNNSGTLQIPKGIPMSAGINETDADYWKVFNFKFLAGAPYNEKSMKNSIVISEDAAHELFGSVEAAVGREIIVNHFNPYNVVGVVENVPIIATRVVANAWIPITDYHSSGFKPQLGDFSVTILARDKADFPAIRKEVQQRALAYDKEMEATGYNINLLGGPFTQDAVRYKKWSNQAPDTEAPRRRSLITFAILLLIPAVNLSSMTQSRLRRRVSEMGVRRAFGCTRWRLIRGIITENFIVTLAGGVLGLIVSALFGWLCADLLFVDYYIGDTPAHVNVWMLLNWRTLLWAVGFCFVLNLLSSGIPAWRASRVSPVEAIK